MKTYDELKKISDSFFRLCRKTVSQYPWAVCIAMHEYFRTLFPDDPYIKFTKNLCPTERVYGKTKDLISFLENVHGLGSYAFSASGAAKKADVKILTGGVYGKFWQKFSFEELTDKATVILKERLTKNNFDLSYFKGKKAIDIGCGSGRFSFALRRLGCASVVGVDYGDDGLKIARGLVKKSGVKNLSFRKVNVLKLPFKDNTFDFVYCNGVLHHTKNMELGLKEMVRVAKPRAKMWLYLYADGGIFWYARKKMPSIMKKIDQRYTMAALDMIGMPRDRFIFADNWYVPIERHTTDKEARGILASLGIKKIQRLKRGRSTDLEYMSFFGGREGKILYGDGELRYILEK